MTATRADLKAALDRLYRAAYDLQAERMSAEFTIQELRAQPEDNTALIERIQKLVDKCQETENEIADQIDTIKKAIKIMDGDLFDSTWIVW